MAAGDLITGDFQIELRTTLMGDTTDFDLVRRGGAISGLFATPVKLVETPYAHADGSFIGESFAEAKTVTVALEVIGSTATAAGDNLETMHTVWAPAASAEIPLYFQVPGFGKRYVNGWPLGVLSVDYSTPDFAVIPILVGFRLADPTIYTP